MNKKNTSWLDLVLFILLFVATMGTIALQIFFSSPTSTKIETSLFSILQFIFSLAFSWLLARMSLRDEFQESQKKFAISAYRRIIEISNAVNRLIARTSSHMERNDEYHTNHELDVITEIGLGIRESIKSSVSDWADIIGDEIEIVERIRALREEQYLESSTVNFAAGDVVMNVQKDKQAIGELISKLPNSLKITAEELGKYSSVKQERAEAKFNREIKRKGYIEIEGRHESTFDRDIFSFNEGDILHVRIDDNDTRVAALIAFDEENRSVGIILNNLSGISDSYADFSEMLVDYLGRSKFQIQILNINRDEDNDDEESVRHYFSAKIIDSYRKSED